jgi:phosphate transport system substrate-binding protein
MHAIPIYLRALLFLLAWLTAWSGRALPVQESIRVDGSSTVYPLTEHIARRFERSLKGNPRVLLGISGTSGGFKLFCRGMLDIANASRPIGPDEMAACHAAGIRYLEIPVAFDAITVVINPRNTWARSMTITELGRVWDQASEGVVTRWSDIRPDWPAQPLSLFMPGMNSATSEYFTQVIIGKGKSSRRDLTCSENDNILMRGVALDPYALGYFGYSYYLNNRRKVRAVALDCGCGETVIPSVSTVLGGRYFPLSRPLFLYVSERSLERPAVREFLRRYLSQVGDLAAKSGFFPLPKQLYELGRARIDKPVYGTVFGGQLWTGLHIEELFAHVPQE